MPRQSIFSHVLNKSEYDKIISCDSTKEIWDRLQVLHESIDQIKETKIGMLVHQYKMFKMVEHENIDKMTNRFMHIINKLKVLGKKKYTNAEMVRKILRSLSKAWRPKVLAIQSYVFSERIYIKYSSLGILSNLIVSFENRESSKTDSFAYVGSMLKKDIRIDNGVSHHMQAA